MATGTVTGDSDRRKGWKAYAAIAQHVFVIQGTTADTVETAGANAECMGINQSSDTDYTCATPLQGGVSGDIINVVVDVPTRLASS